MTERIIDLLADPQDSESLEFGKDPNCLKNPGDPETEYPIEAGVPILLPREAAQLFKTTPLHEAHGTKFHYIDHYKKDARFFDYYEEIPAASTRHEVHRLHQAILSEVPAGTRRVLDLGCGNAWVAEALCPGGIEVVSFDISLENTSRALKKYPYDNHAAVVGDVYALPFKDEVFDTVISAEVMEHLPDVRSYLSGLIRITKPGGTIIITTPYNEKLSYNLCVHCNCPTPKNAHLHSFNEEKADLLIREFEKISGRSYAFSNIALARLRTHILLQYAPFPLWRIVDKLANLIYQVPMRLLIKISKE